MAGNDKLRAGPVIAVFGDVHGALDAMYGLCRRWERRNGSIGLVLQTGDMGIFPDALDKATLRHAQQDQTELGARDYIEGTKTPEIDTVFVRGNHEDHAWLARFGPGGAIDPSGRLHYLTGFRTKDVDVNGIPVRIAGLGGIAPHGRRNIGKDPEAGFQPEELDALLAEKPRSIDILLTHDAPRGYGLRDNPDSGADEITLAIEHLCPRYAFYGHYGHPPDQFEIGSTVCVPMTYDRALRLPRRDGAMGILRPADWTFAYVGR